MRLTPLEIKKQEFSKSMRGFDPVEVNTFIEKLADDYEELLQENEKLHKQLITAQTELKHFQEVEKTLKQTLYNVQETSQLSKENSQKEANLIKKEAELAATKMMDRARQEVHTMREEINTLRQQKESFIARLRHLLSSQMELLEVLEIDDNDVAKIKDKTKKSFSAGRTQKTVTPAPRPETPEIITPESQATPPSAKSAKSAENRAKGHEFFNDIFNSDEI